MIFYGALVCKVGILLSALRLLYYDLLSLWAATKNLIIELKVLYDCIFVWRRDLKEHIIDAGEGEAGNLEEVHTILAIMTISPVPFGCTIIG